MVNIVNGGASESGPSHGATVKPIYTVWCPKMYVIAETQLTEISHFNTQATVWFALFSALATTAVGIWMNAAFESGALSPLEKLLTDFGAPLCLFIGIVFCLLGIHSLITRNSILSTIKNESKVVDPEQ